ncbi:MAG: RIP metalloprotease RseP [Clostridiales bacterium]|jgi:regulator of sigma E protease|nr:RIP metalloprotease RseP [Clostridiales bacterium]
MLTFIASVVIFGLLIFFHELGHFIVAKRLGIGVIEFAIGFGPKAMSRQIGETVYSLRVFPLGGFVRLVGEDPEEVEEDGSFQKQPVWRRFAVIVSGPVMNFILAVLLFSLIYFAFIGVPVYQSTAIGELLPGGRAEQAGLMAGDRITSVAGEEVGKWLDLVALINAHPDTEIIIEFERENQLQSITVTPQRDPQAGIGLIGIWPQTRMFAVFPSLSLGITHTVSFLRFIAVSIVKMITGRAPADVVGPVGIIQIVGEVARTGVVNLLSLAAIISLNLGFLNLLPIPALDGSRLMFLVVEGIRGRPVDPHKESFVHFVGFTVLILLMIVIAYRDLVRLNIFF